MLPYDVRQFTDEKRERLAWHIHQSEDFDLPHLDTWNYDPCRKHHRGWVRVTLDAEGKEVRTVMTDEPFPGCRECGIRFRKHQRVGIMWLYLKKRALLADPMGTGKTTHAGGLISLLHQTGELESVGKVVVVPRAPALPQWNRELHRMMPNLNLVMANGTAAQRREQYGMGWDVLLISPQTLINDHRMLLDNFALSALITDDVDPLRNHKNQTAFTLKALGEQADRMVVMTGTPFQKRLQEAHSSLEALGGKEVFGPLPSFERKYITRRTIREINPQTGHLVSQQVTAYKNMTDFKQKMAPMVLRRRIEDLDDVSMPEINPNDVFLDLYPRQKAKYAELKAGILSILKADGGAQIKHVGAMAQIMYGAQICGGLATLGEEDSPQSSIKMDWIEEKLTNELEDEKVVIFANFKNSVRALQDRFRRNGIGFATIWGEQPKKDVREAEMERFWRDSNCRVLIGTQAIEQSLNLQISRHLINMDMILNPARMAQLAGRIRRDGSAFKHVFVHNLLAVGTQEERYLPLLEREAALSSHIWDENSELFNALSPQMLLQLITG